MVRMALLMMCCLIVACDRDESIVADAGPDAPRTDGGFGAGDESGRITIRERPGGPPSLFGELVTGGLPRWHVETMRMGGCRLLEYQPAFCDPPCTGVCGEGNVCTPYPEYVSAGNITVSGMRAQVTLTPSGCGFCSGGVQYFSLESHPNDLFDDDAAITASAPGAAFPAFSVSAGGVPPLQAPFAGDKITIVDDQDHTITWTSAGSDARVRLTLNANNQGHGAPYLGILECDGEDTGSLVVPGALIAGFPETMAWEACAGSDCPRSTLMRYHRGTVEAGGGLVELLVGSEIQFGVDHNPN
jgi:hypothetical protein